jgi:mannose-6-phosphate isomerase-like protein (cupin superfamily)
MHAVVRNGLEHFLDTRRMPGMPLPVDAYSMPLVSRIFPARRLVSLSRAQRKARALEHRDFRLKQRSKGSLRNKPQDYPYATFLNILHPPLSIVDVPALVAACTDRWYNQTLCKVNDSVVRLGVMQGEYHWHKHDNDDEFFFVLDGKFIIDLEERSVELGEREGFVVPKGIVHRTRAPERAVIMMVESATIVPTGDA